MALSERLRAARSERGLTLESASAKSNVALRYVRMFEDGNYPMVSDPAYLTGFVGRYAACLGLNELQASNEFIAEVVNCPVVMPNVTRSKRLGFPGGFRPGHARPRLFKFYAGPLSVIAALWIVGPLSPLNNWTEETPPSEWVMTSRRELAPAVTPQALPTSQALAPPPALTTEPPPLPVEAVLPATMDTQAGDVAAVDQKLVATVSEQKSSSVDSGRSETNKASDALRAAQLARMKQRMSSKEPPS